MRRPRIKSVFPPIPLGDGRIRIGGGDYGIASEMVDDEHGNTWHLLNLMDGTRTRAELGADMAEHCPEIAAGEVNDAIDALIDMGFVEDAAAPPPAELPAAELERYRRNLEFFSYFHKPPLTSADFQLRLRNARVTVLGIGGLGSYVAMSLAAIGVGDILLVDHDDVELMNLNRQVLYTDGDVGSPKVQAAVRRLTEINPHIRVTARNAMVDGVASARSCMAGRDLVICAADRPRLTLYQWLNEAALLERTAWMRGSNDGLTVSLFLHVPYQTACFQCVEQDAAATHPEYTPMADYVVGVIGDRTINPCNAPMAGMIGNLAALEAVKYLTGIAEPVITGRKLVVDVHRMETQFAEGTLLDDCTACGPGGRVPRPQAATGHQRGHDESAAVSSGVSA
ncbi:ThiF family adenylyltransferase [Micromonospora sp. NPDC006766]|uniref:ThiF family adenylyltransferase n=1 Tax=Micromonospora sp. NPDC006766 TaxID=3154778 RepID=UPI0033D98B72